MNIFTACDSSTVHKLLVDGLLLGESLCTGFKCFDLLVKMIANTWCVAPVQSSRSCIAPAPAKFCLCASQELSGSPPEKTQARTLDHYIYTVSQKKVPTFKLSVTLSNRNRFKKKFCTARKAIKFATKPIQQYHLTLGMSLH